MRAIVGIPQVRVALDGAPLDPQVAETLTEVRVQQKLSLPDQCEITFVDVPAAFDLRATSAPGCALRVAVDGFTEPLFVGEITAIEYSYEASGERALRLRGYDRLHRLRKRQPMRAHVQVTAADLARELVSDLGLSVEAATPDPLYPYTIQHSQSDLQLLTDVAARAGLYTTLRGDTVHLITLEGIGEPIPLAIGELLHEARVEVNGEAACRSVSAAGWNPLRADSYRARITTPRSGRTVAAAVEPERVGGSGERVLANETISDEAHAQAVAQAQLDVRVAREITLTGVATGDPRLKPGARVSLARVADALCGDYVLTGVTHVVDQQGGFLSQLSTVPPAPRSPTPAVRATIGTVTRVDDSDGRGRVRVMLPTYGDVETPWMSVLGAGAGAGRSLQMLPEIGDPVLVLFDPDDPAQGVVLGSLYGVDVKDRAVRRYTLLTPGGQRLQLDDENKLLRLENTDGSHVELGPKTVRLHATVDLEIEAPGRRVTIRGNAIDFERA